jgi:hypothetical protein
MAIVNTVALLFVLFAQAAAFAQGKVKETASVGGTETADTVVFLAQSDLERLVMIEARHEQRRLLTIVPVGKFQKSFSLYIAQKKLAAKDQVRTASASFLPSLFEFSSPRLAVYADKNPCSQNAEQKNDQANDQASVSVAGMPFFKIDTGATATFDLLSPAKKAFSPNLSGLSKTEKDQITALAKAGFGIVQISFKPTKESGSSVRVMPAFNLAWEDTAPIHRSQIVGKHSAIVDRLFLAPEAVELLENVEMASFPTGIELPHEAAAVFPSIYNDWAAGVLAKGHVIKGYAGPVNRCELCYDKPPSAEVLHNAGVFWQAKVPDVNPANLRSKKMEAPSGSALDTWISRHVFKKSKVTPLRISAKTERSSVTHSFVEQGSVERPFLGEILCPAMDGYQKQLVERRSKTLIALNSLSGWNEEKLSAKTDDAGVVRPSWFQEHWQKKP